MRQAELAQCRRPTLMLDRDHLSSIGSKRARFKWRRAIVPGWWRRRPATTAGAPPTPSILSTPPERAGEACRRSGVLHATLENNLPLHRRRSRTLRRSMADDIFTAREHRCMRLASVSRKSADLLTFGPFCFQNQTRLSSKFRRFVGAKRSRRRRLWIR